MIRFKDHDLGDRTRDGEDLEKEVMEYFEQLRQILGLVDRTEFHINKMAEDYEIPKDDHAREEALGSVDGVRNRIKELIGADTGEGEDKPY